jgi:hypothetical protein
MSEIQLRFTAYNDALAEIEKGNMSKEAATQVASSLADAIVAHPKRPVDRYLLLQEIKKACDARLKELYAAALDDTNGVEYVQVVHRTQWSFDHISAWMEAKNKMKAIEATAKTEAENVMKLGQEAKMDGANMPAIKSQGKASIQFPRK